MLNELLYRNGPVLDPSGLPTHNQGTDALPLSCPDFVCAHALDQPNSTVCRDTFVQALLKENLAADAVGYRSTKASKRDSGVRKVLQPYLPLGVGKRNPGWGLEGGWYCDLSVMPPLA